MPTQRNIQTLSELEGKFDTSLFLMVAEYRGLKVKDMQGLRGAIREHGGRFMVAKSTLARLAAERTGRDYIIPFVSGPVGFLILDKTADAATILKHMFTYTNDNNLEGFKVIGGALYDRVLNQDEIIKLSKLPTKEVLQAKLLGLLSAPGSRLVTVLSGPGRGLVVLLDRFTKQKMTAE